MSNSTIKKKDPIQLKGRSIPLSGRFKLTLNRDPEKFHLANINSFIPNGKTANDIVQFKDARGPIDFLLISKLVTVFDPDKSDIDAHNVAVLIQHENVRLEEMSDKEHAALVAERIKKGNPEYTLVNIDKKSIIAHVEARDMIDIQYAIMGTKTNLTKKKLMYITSALGLKTTSHIQDQDRYLQFLRDQLISHLTVNSDDRVRFTYFHDKIEDAEILYFIEEMISLGHIEEMGGMYKIGVKPIGFRKQDIKEYFISNSEEYEALKLEVQKYHQDKVTN